MEKRGPGLVAHSAAVSASEDLTGARLLLVTRNAAWRTAVKHAASCLGGRAVDACGARDALARLAGAGPYYSHLLVDQADAEGLFAELADLAYEVARPDTDMIVLGHSSVRRPRMRSVAVASAESVLEALMADPPPRDASAIALTELHAALDGAKIETRYQPIVRVADRRPVGLEALARLNHPEKGTIQPDRFIPLIEKAGLAGRLTDLVSDRVLADMASVALVKRNLSMSLNFPLDVFLCPESLARLDALRSAAGISAERIVLELTESRPVEDFQTLRQSLERLRGLGYRAALDDVGPAMPRLSRLLTLPFTSVKLDKDLVQQGAVAVDPLAFVRRVVDDAKSRGLTVVAEGVETPEIWSAMCAIGVDEVQGFLAARPLPLAAVPIWLDHWVSTPPRR